MRLGQAAMEALKAEITGCLQPGDELVVACPVALKGTSVIAENKKIYWQNAFQPDLSGIVFLCGKNTERRKRWRIRLYRMNRILIRLKLEARKERRKVLSGILHRKQVPAHYMTWAKAAS
mgnify:CR=1 FL=1